MGDGGPDFCNRQAPKETSQFPGLAVVARPAFGPVADENQVHGGTRMAHSSTKTRHDQNHQLKLACNLSAAGGQLLTPPVIVAQKQSQADGGQIPDCIP